MDTILKFYWPPTIKAAMELDANNPAQAVVFLEVAAPYEPGAPPQLVVTMYPVYIRGQGQLAARNGAAAATEFQKFLDHRDTWHMTRDRPGKLFYAAGCGATLSKARRSFSFTCRASPSISG